MSTLNQRLIEYLEQNKIIFDYKEHAEVKTSAEAAAVRGTRPEQGAKAMLFLADQKPILIVLSGDQRIDTADFKKQYGIKDLRFATADEVSLVTGAIPGAVPPFGNLFKTVVYADQGLVDQEFIAFNAGLRTASIIMKASDFVKLVNPIVGHYVQIQ